MTTATRAAGMWTFSPEGWCACVCVHYAESKHTGTDFGWTRRPPISSACGPGWESGGHKHTSNTDTLSFNSALQMTKHFFAVSTWNFPISSLRWWMWPWSCLALCVRSVFRVLCTLCLDCGLLLTSLWLQIHWHVIYGNEPWRKCSEINQTHPTCTACVPLSVCLEEREVIKDKKNE